MMTWTSGWILSAAETVAPDCWLYSIAFNGPFALCGAICVWIIDKLLEWN